MFHHRSIYFNKPFRIDGIFCDNSGFLINYIVEFQGAVRFAVHVPSMPDKPEFRLDGRMLSITLPLTESVAVVKAKIHEETGLQPGKQKLSQDVSYIPKLYKRLTFVMISS